MKKWFAAGLLSVPLMSNPAPLFAQPPAVADTVVEYRPDGEGWSVKLPTAWKVISAEADRTHFPETLVSRATQHTVLNKAQLAIQVLALRFKREEPLSAEQKALFREGALAELDKRHDKVSTANGSRRLSGCPSHVWWKTGRSNRWVTGRR